MDNLSPSRPPPTIYYLTITTPHTDTFTFHGPHQTFAALLPHIETAVSISPSAVQKLRTLRQQPGFLTTGFKRLDIPLPDPDPGADPDAPTTKTILRIVTEENAAVHAFLPIPVYTVLVQGPLVHDFSREGYVGTGRPIGVARNSWIAGSWVEFEEAKAVAREKLEELVAGRVGVARVEKGEGKGRWLCMAMDTERVWEVYVRFDEKR